MTSRHIGLLFLPAVMALLAGMAGGLERLGLDLGLPELSGNLLMLHGPLMICGFFGTVIALERAVALSAGWTFAAPALTGAGGLAMIAGVAPALAALLITVGAALFLIGALVVVRHHPSLHTGALALGAAAWLLGDIGWLAGGAVAPVSAAWALFLLLTIAGERLELSRFLPPRRGKAAAALLIVFLLSVAAALLFLDHPAGAPLLGAGLIALMAWLFRFDLVRQTWRKPGVTGYVAQSLGSGFAWLGVAGLICLVFGLPAGGPVYDAVLHAVFLGFVFAMVFGHMPIILPALLRVPQPFHPALYLPLLLLHGGLALRIAGDLLEMDGWRRTGGLIAVSAILLFAGVTLASLSLAARPAQRRLDPRTHLR